MKILFSKVSAEGDQGRRLRKPGNKQGHVVGTHLTWWIKPGYFSLNPGLSRSLRASLQPRFSIIVRIIQVEKEKVLTHKHLPYLPTYTHTHTHTHTPVCSMSLRWCLIKLGKADSHRAKQIVMLVATLKQVEIGTLLTSPSTIITDACRKLAQNTVRRLKVAT